MAVNDNENRLATGEESGGMSDERNAPKCETKAASSQGNETEGEIKQVAGDVSNSGKEVDFENNPGIENSQDINVEDIEYDKFITSLDKSYKNIKTTLTGDVIICCILTIVGAVILVSPQYMHYMHFFSHIPVELRTLLELICPFAGGAIIITNLIILLMKQIALINLEKKTLDARLEIHNQYARLTIMNSILSNPNIVISDIKNLDATKKYDSYEKMPQQNSLCR